MAVDTERLRAGLMPGAWYALGVLIVFYFLNSFDRTILSLMVAHVKSDMGVTDTKIGLLLGLAFAVFYGFFGVPFGILVDRYSRRLILFAGVIVWSLATIACGLSGNYAQLLVARMVLGIGEATLMPAAHTILADKFPGARLGTAMSIYYFGGIVGSSASVALGGLAVSYFSQFPIVEVGGLISVRGWQTPLLILGAVGVVCASLGYTFSESPRPRRDSTAPEMHLPAPIWPGISSDIRLSAKS